ncbi:hypothetical protein Oweho_1409 [Owenweeksia hongkongensis DSM 17368]|uniref:Uncharacterized protein n=1 Tax=Owenweeksia hongkongensis (strain DSM 17368 / CIP 108786 / JCM 12287 / NRRL B-23963 / UST20020801) TaxID=926562 RepID=G8R838_OWEHD|nr:hypothetical protein [Owenweeksia hongkongensis]AEV32406.1 hypothetical protein Oweho_1409 [Owenweeksia hongkongensis DSM 17368]
MPSTGIHSISPAEHYYLSNLIAGSEAEMLKLTLQDLCLRQILNISRRSIVIDLRLGKPRPRIFIGRGEKFSDYENPSNAENFFLKLFKDKEELRFFAIRRYVKNELDKSSFDKLVNKDLKKKGLCYFKLIPSGKAIKYRKLIDSKIDELNSQIDNLILNDHESLNKKIEGLACHILHLEEDNLKKLEANSELLHQVSFLQISNTQFNSNLFTSIGLFSTMDSGSFADFSGFDGFGGFGGGDFGGGGAMGSW